MPIDHTDLALMQAIADGGTPAGAARATGLTQASAGRRLARLEDRFGALTARRGEQIELTARGRAIVDARRRLLAALADGLRQVAGADRLPELRLAVFGRTWDAFADDLAVHAPGMLLALCTADPVRAVELFERRAVDAAYVWRPCRAQVTPSRTACVLPVLDEPLWVCLPAGHRCAGQAAVALADLAADDWIAARPAESAELVRGVCAAAGFLPRLAHRADSAATVRSLVGHGRGVALASPLAPAPPAGGGFVLRPLTTRAYRAHRLVTDPGVVSTGLARLLRARLRFGYRAKALLRNPRYVQMPWFPVPSYLSGERPLLSPVSTEGLPLSAPGGSLEIDMEDMHLLQVISRSGSLNRAAPVLSVSQPALSRRIQRLEDRLGVTLLVRGSRGTRLAPAAWRLLAVASEAEAVLRAAIGNGA
ncbi:LysR family transcriptional regulator [Nonomuraea zeae]|nr:LysR family transcriptional regulator [Nonomuraea zeae]